MATPVIRTRFAPSPSGHLHVGGARTALFNWAYAKRRGGTFILRIEDTDQKRSSAAAALGFLADLEWLGIHWDEGPVHGTNGGGDVGPYVQSERNDTYGAYVERLIADGRAYRAFETSEELDTARGQARAAKQNYRYDRAALALDAETVAAYVAEGRPHVVRFRLPDQETVVVQDQVRGDVTVTIDELDDFIIVKNDGYPTYHFAVVVDDELMGVTHVVRGEEHLNNTLKHVLLQDALGFRRPVYAHLSLIFNPDGSKMSKRDKDKALRRTVKERSLEGAASVDAETWSWWLGKKDRQLDTEVAERLARELDVALPEINVDDFRRAGYLPDVLVNYLALLGWSPGSDREQFDTDFLVEHFDFDRIIKSAAKFDRDKLLAFNLDALQALSAEAFAELYVAHLECYHPEFGATLGPERLRLLAAANQARSKTLDDTVASSRFFITPDDDITWTMSKPVRKAIVNGEPNGLAHLDALRPRLAALATWTAESIEAEVAAYAEDAADGNLGKVAQPLRIAVSGGPVSPAIFETLMILGQASTVRRIERCLACDLFTAAT